MWRWLVIIARDRPELWATWTCVHGGAERMAVHFDRRRGQAGTGRGAGSERRVRPNGDTELEARGFLVIPRPDLVGACR
jgi:hypothetical protein